MTPRLRKLHRYIWFGLALLLPAAWLAAIWVIPDTVWQEPVRPAQPEALAAVVRTKQSGDLLFNLRGETTGSRRQLEVIIQKPLDMVNATLVLESEPETVLGQLGSRGIWRFALDSLASPDQALNLRLEDKIQQKVRYRISL